MENLEKTRNQTDGLILYILSKGLRHIDELKQIIDEKFSTVKIGTLYSIITRLKTQKYITETRASSLDGSRRKYFSLTDLGRKVYEEKYLTAFSNVEVLDSSFVPESFIKQQKKSKPNLENQTIITEPNNEKIETDKEVNTAPTYEEIIKNAEFTSDFIDFSILENEDKLKENLKIEAENNINEILNNDDKEIKKEDFLSYTENINIEENKIDKEDFDSVINSKFEYSSVLEKLFPKNSNNITLNNNINNEEELNIDNKEDESNIKISPVKQTWNDAYELAEKEGIKIRTSSDTNRYQGNKILFNKLQLVSSIILLVLASLEYLVLTLFFGVPLSLATFSKILIIFGIILFIMLAIYIIYPNYKVKDLPKLINVIEISIVLVISTLIICFAISAIIEINYSNVFEVFNVIILPTVISLNLPIFFLIEHAISKLEMFQSL